MESHPKTRSLDEPGGFEALLDRLELSEAVSRPERRAGAHEAQALAGASLPASPIGGGFLSLYGARRASSALARAPSPSPSSTFLSEDAQPPATSAPILIARGRAVAHPPLTDSFALAEPHSVPMARTRSNGLSVSTASHVPSHYQSCDYSETSSLRLGIESMLEAQGARRPSMERVGRSRRLASGLLSPSARSASVDISAGVERWRRQEMDPLHGSREDGTEHFAFMTDEELQENQWARLTQRQDELPKAPEPQAR